MLLSLNLSNNKFLLYGHKHVDIIFITIELNWQYDVTLYLANITQNYVCHMNVIQMCTSLQQKYHTSFTF